MHQWTRPQLGQPVRNAEGLFSRVTATPLLFPSLFSSCFNFVTGVLALVLLSWSLAEKCLFIGYTEEENKYYIYFAGFLQMEKSQDFPREVKEYQSFSLITGNTPLCYARIDRIDFFWLLFLLHSSVNQLINDI